jgi:exodeoxyribonuclease VIII
MAEHTPPLPFESYRAIDAVNWSTLRHIAVSPLEYRYRLAQPPAETPAMALGTAVHTAILEPDTFDATYTTEPDFGDCRVKANKAARDEWRAAHADRIALSAEAFESCQRMRAAVFAHDVARRLVTEGHSEVSFTWTHERTGVACKGRQDRIGPKGMTSLKTSRVVDPDGFGVEVARRLYHGQEAFYVDGYHAGGGPLLPVSYVVAQNVAPYDVAVYEIPEEVIDEGRELYERLLDTLAECRKTQQWRGVCPDVLYLRFPAWARSDRDDQDATGLDLTINGQAMGF